MLKLDPKNTELLAQKQEVLNKSIINTEDKLKQLQEIKAKADEEMANGTEINEQNYRNLQREIIATQNKLSDLKNEASNWTKAGDALVKWGEKLDKIGQKLNDLGNKLTTRLTVPIATAFGASVKEAVEFESAFTGVEKTVDGTEQQMEKLKQGIRDLAKEIPSTTTEISAVAEAAGQLGIETDNILGFSKAMIDLGNSTNLTSDEAAQQLARFANITKMSQKDFDKLGASIVDLGNNFATTESDIVAMAMRLAGAGNQVGMSEGQILGLATALSSVGIEAEMGGSAISKAMVKMQNAVELGGGKLETVLKKTGMSLRDLELLSANNSKDFKALADGIGLTSTELKNMITAGANLRDFSKVAGMSAEQFKKAWKEDATGALSAFIQGLGNAEDKGESAITMLSEMGLTEVRLRDSLLRASNASDLFNKAIKTGSEAFDENIALTKEANKRYKTTESQLKITKNQIKDIAISLGNKLLPIIKNLLQKVDKWVDKFNKLSDSEQENIIKIGLLVATAGPALKLASSSIGILGKVSTGIGTFSKAIALAHNGIGTATGSAAALAKVLQGLTSPVGLAITAIVGLTGASIALGKAHHDSIIGLNGLKEEVDKQTESWNKLRQARNENLDTYLSEIAENQKLSDELNKIVDENGKIKEGYEKRVEYITGKLSEALGIEIKINDKIIDNYKEIKQNINELITAKKAEALLNAYQGEYQEALKKQADATRTLVDLKEQQKQKMKELAGASGIESYEIQKTLDSLATNIGKQTELIGEYGFTIERYENLQTASVSGSAEKIKIAVDDMGKSWEQAKKQTKENIEAQLLSQAIYVEGIEKSLNEAEKKHNTYQANILRTQKENEEKRLKELENSLIEQISTVENLTDEQIKAWKELAQGGLDSYKKVLSELPIETVDKIQKATGVIAIDTTLQKASGSLATDAITTFDRNLIFKEATENALKQSAIQIRTNTEVQDSTKEMAKNVEKAFKNNTDGDKWGKDLTGQISSGMTNTSSKNSIVSASNKVAGWIKSILGFSLPETGPLSDFDKSMPDMIDLMVKGMQNSEYKLQKEVNRLALDINKEFSNINLFNGKMKNQIIDSTKTVFTTPQITFNVQKMNKENLDECFNYINKKFGSAY